MTRTSMRISASGGWAVRATVAISLLALTSPAGAGEGPYVAASYAYSGFQTRCDGGACDRRDSGVRAAVGWAPAPHWSVEALYLDAGRFVASDVTAAGTPFDGRARLRAWGGTLGYAWPLGAKFTVGARAGMASVTADFEPGPAPAIAGGRTTAQFIGGLSMSWRLSTAWSARLDWDHTRGRMNRFDGDVDAASVGIQFGF